MARSKTVDPIQEAAQVEADELIGLAQMLERLAAETRRDAAAIRAHARGLKPGEIGMLPGWGYAYAKNRTYAIDAWRNEERVGEAR